MPIPIAPGPTAYDPRFGGIPGVVGLPNPEQDLAQYYPNLSGSTAQASADVLAKMRGELSPGTINSIQDAAARFGVSSGMPGIMPGTLAGNRGLRDIGLNAEEQAQQGLQDFNALTSNVSNTQTVRPETQIALAEQNAVNQAAPNPAQAQTYAESLFNKYLDMIHPKNPRPGQVGGAPLETFIGANTGGEGKISSSDPNWGSEFWSFAHAI